jgi:hypothetical protein
MSLLPARISGIHLNLSEAKADQIFTTSMGKAYWRLHITAIIKKNNHSSG